ncbi:ArsA-related P-loop ATPase [Arsenicicoccus dermatophilus]|nr:ArsA-related P-loop ATPase [Arsenicicoccus dermatophilus]MCH8611706.1 AAA family ATPase [Arsenicicoccus dermatophilus]
MSELARDPGTRVVLSCGAGGVGKTTTSAALALAAAESGRRVVVLTIDPARRLAQSLGLVELDDVPREVAGVDRTAGGRLDAMMLDMKRTFDEVVLTHASPQAAEQILANPFYQAVSSSFAGTQEYMAMEKLGQLRQQADREGTWDLVVVDTPPSRSALDFLDAPARLGSFLDGRLVRLLTAPARVGGRLGARSLVSGMAVATSVLSRLLGGELLRDVQTFVLALNSVFGGFRERADRTYAMLSEPGTAFVVVTTPEPAAVREAEFFMSRLRAEAMPLAGLVVNRVVRPVTGSPGAREAMSVAERLLGGGAAGATRALLRLASADEEVAERQAAVVAGLRQQAGGLPLSEVPAAGTDVHDLAGLRTVAASL